MRVCSCGAKQDNRPGRQNRLENGDHPDPAPDPPDPAPDPAHGSDFIYTKISARPGDGGAILMKMAVFPKENVSRVNVFLQWGRS